jgi:hypothetical protein
MASPDILEYVRSFLSPRYVDNLDPPFWFMKIRRQAADTESETRASTPFATATTSGS